MPSAAAFLTWLTHHAAALLAASVVATVGVEQAVAFRRRHADVRGSVTSVTGGLAYLAVKAIVSKGLMFGVALAVYERRWFDVDWRHPLVWLGIFVARDFVSYWIHRAEHRVRVLWASHLVHHSIERFTFTSAVRLPWMESLYKPVLALWAPLLGFHPVALAAIGAIVLLVGQLQHTELLRRRTVLDLVFVTPSAHRVHHASNREYLDRNFGSMLIVWDRLFGTYAPESSPVRYGLAGGTRIRTTGEVLLGGYPRLFADLRRRTGWRARAHTLLAAP